MKIIQAEHSGFCFGVKRAMDLAFLEIDKSNEYLYSYGPLIHNKQVVEDLTNKGIIPINNISEIKSGRIIIRSHGVSEKTINEFQDKNIEVIDTTCPYVKKVHSNVRTFMEKGYHIIIVGSFNHPEVIGINGWCDNKGIILNDIKEANRIKNLDKVLIVSQTTNKEDHFLKIVDIIKSNNKEIKALNTICSATTDRQNSCKKLSTEADAMVVIGGFHSSNTTKLKEVSEKHCKNVYHIETIKDLPLQEIAKFNTIGVTAGASTPDCIIREVIQVMNSENEMEMEMTNEMMEAIDSSFTKIHRGDVLKGEVLFVTDTEVMVNINYTSDGIIDRDELSNDPDVEPRDLFEPGEEIQVYVMRMDDGDGNVVLSAKRVEESKSWEDLEEKYENKERVVASVIRDVKGGLAVLVEGLNAFMPASHVSVNFVSDLKVYKGKELESEIIDFDKTKRRIILSRKEVEKEELEEKRAGLWEELEEGQLIKGVVRRLTNFGAFVDLGGLDGLIHISDLAWHRVKHPSEIVKADEEVEVQILGLDQERNRISLGLKQTMEKPWDVFVREVEEGDTVPGKVVNLLDFGAFVRLEQGVDGLLHVSQISSEHIDKPADVFAIGDDVEVRVINIDKEDQKISLSTKTEDEDEITDELQSEDIETEEDPDVTIGDIIE